MDDVLCLASALVYVFFANYLIFTHIIPCLIKAYFTNLWIERPKLTDDQKLASLFWVIAVFFFLGALKFVEENELGLALLATLASSVLTVLGGIIFAGKPKNDQWMKISLN